MPKKAVTSLMELDANDAEFLTDLYSSAQNLIARFHLISDEASPTGTSLITED